ncbi:unnamed protein product [Eruca vesicaria subsp. sativa]|uniref:S-protein homolog n=1 Tax=Eruca vesicaria subsp. sativa TaxID=29727 RepID=A0ABC8KDH3_ERUVS|nr:unnamed protein product [Eruca vesicaria subsp. sativa]
MYIALSEALPPVKDCICTLEIQNKLGFGQILDYKCGKIVNSRPHGFLKFNEKFRTRFISVVSNTWICWLSKGPKSDSYGYELKINLPALKPPCNNELHKWIAKNDGIYFERDGKNPKLVEIQNKLGFGQILAYKCGKIVNSRPHGFLKFNEKFRTGFISKGVVSNTWICGLSKGPKTDSYAYELKINLPALKPPCNNELHKWIAKNDGIYFERDAKNPKLVDPRNPSSQFFPFSRRNPSTVGTLIHDPFPDQPLVRRSQFLESDQQNPDHEKFLDNLIRFAI